MLGGIPSFLSHNSVYGEQLEDQDVDISSGSTVSHSGGLTIKQLTGGPYTINNRGTIEATNVTSNSDAIRLEVGSSVTNSGLIDSSGSANLSSIYFTNNLESNSLSNSGTIQTETTGNYGQGIHIEDANLAEITNAAGGTIKVTDSALNSGAIRVDTGAVVNTITTSFMYFNEI